MNPTIVFCAILSMAASAVADVKIPKTVYRSGDLEKAKAEAKAKGKPISILYTSEKSSCPYVDAGTERALQEMKSKTVMVYFQTSETAYDSMPANVVEALRAPGSGPIPKLAIFDADLSAQITNVPYSRDDKTLDKSYREAARKLRESKAASGNR